MSLKWKKKLPIQPGFYWYRNVDQGEKDPTVMNVRDYAGDLAIGNSTLKGWDRMLTAEWAGPVPEPESEKPVSIFMARQQTPSLTLKELFCILQTLPNEWVRQIRKLHRCFVTVHRAGSTL